MSLLIVFEGCEGAGKTTQAKILYGRLCQIGYGPIMIREPGGTTAGEEIRRLITTSREVLWALRRGANHNHNFPFPASPRSQLLSRDLWPSLTPEAELLLFMASRVQLIKEVMIPSLQKGRVIICDRFIHSTLAYQGYGRGIDLQLIAGLNSFCTKGINPDLVIFMDVDVEMGLKRKMRGNEVSRFEEEDPSFHKKVREGYQTLYEDDGGERWFKVDAKLPRKEIATRIFDRVKQLLPGREAMKPKKFSEELARQGQL